MLLYPQCGLATKSRPTAGIPGIHTKGEIDTWLLEESRSFSSLTLVAATDMSGDGAPPAAMESLSQQRNEADVCLMGALVRINSAETGGPAVRVTCVMRIFNAKKHKRALKKRPTIFIDLKSVKRLRGQIGQIGSDVTLADGDDPNDGFYVQQ
ncbi:hypothetical protein BJV77DRAFT_962193 [Russula vinacea]|nr:hypothetical protein BJV77DRAFT_962193 [Russula vinacea]